MDTSKFSFWSWFLLGRDGRPGLLRLLNIWMLIHIAIGVFLGLVVKSSLQLAGNTVLLPLTGILIGLSFAWAGNAQALLQTSEMRDVSKHRQGGLAEYVYAYQTAILVILVTIVSWGLAGLGIFDDQWPTTAHPKLYTGVKTILFGLASLTLRECWHVVLGTQWMLLTREELKKSRNSQSNQEC